MRQERENCTLKEFITRRGPGSATGKEERAVPGVRRGHLKIENGGGKTAVEGGGKKRRSFLIWGKSLKPRGKHKPKGVNCLLRKKTRECFLMGFQRGFRGRLKEEGGRKWVKKRKGTLDDPRPKEQKTAEKIWQTESQKGTALGEEKYLGCDHHS